MSASRPYIDAGSAERGPIAAPRVEPSVLVVQSGGIKWTRVAGPRRLSRIFKVLYGTVAVVGLVAGILSPSNGVLFITPLTLLLWPLLIVSFILSLTEKLVPGALTILPESVQIALRGAQPVTFRRDAIVGVLFVERRVGAGSVPTVELEMANGDRYAVRTVDGATAGAILDALGSGVYGARTLVRLGSPSRRLLHALVGAAAYQTAGVAAMFFIGASGVLFMYGAFLSGLSGLLALGLYALLRPFVRSADVVVGADGIAVQRRFLRGTRFVGADGFDKAIGGAFLLDAERVAAVRGLAAARQSGLASPSFVETRRAAFGRAGAPDVGTWRVHLRHALEQSSYRSAASPIEEAAATLRGAHATPEERIGAAMAMRIGGEPPARIRIAADAVADERVREAVEAVLADDDAAVDRALRKL